VFPVVASPLIGTERGRVSADTTPLLQPAPSVEPDGGLLQVCVASLIRYSDALFFILKGNPREASGFVSPGEILTAGANAPRQIPPPSARSVPAPLSRFFSEPRISSRFADFPLVTWARALEQDATVMKWLKHAFAIDDGQSDEPTPAQRDAVDRVLTEIVRRGMVVPAQMVLETCRPLNFVAAQLIHFFSPIVRISLGLQGQDDFARFLERRRSIDYLLNRLQELVERQRPADPVPEAASESN